MNEKIKSHLINYVIKTFDEETCKEILNSKDEFINLIEENLNNLKITRKSMIDWEKEKQKIMEENRKQKELEREQEMEKQRELNRLMEIAN